MATTSTIATNDQTLKAEVDVFIPEIWSSAVAASFKKNLVLGNYAKDFSALVAGGGDKINIPTQQFADDAVAKVQGTPVDFTTNTEVDMSIPVDQHYITAVMLDDLAKVQSSYELLSKYADSMAYKLAIGINAESSALPI